MRKLNKNYLRNGWVLLTNGVVIFLCLSAPIRAHREHLLLYEAMRTAPPPFSYFHELFSDPWSPTIVAILTLGIASEFFRSILSPIINLGIYAVWLMTFLWEEAKVVRGAAPSEVSPGVILVLIITPVVAVLGVNLAFYTHALRRADSQEDRLGIRQSAQQR
jgi:hypothetical protein